MYEICTFQALRERLRCKEIWVIGADKWRNPDEDLPADFEAQRASHYAALRKPLDATEFIEQLREEMRNELGALDAAVPTLGWLEIADRGKNGPRRHRAGTHRLRQAAVSGAFPLDYRATFAFGSGDTFLTGRPCPGPSTVKPSVIMPILYEASRLSVWSWVASRDGRALGSTRAARPGRGARAR